MFPQPHRRRPRPEGRLGIRPLRGSADGRRLHIRTRRAGYEEPYDSAARGGGISPGARQKIRARSLPVFRARRGTRQFDRRRVQHRQAPQSKRRGNEVRPRRGRHGAGRQTARHPPHRRAHRRVRERQRRPGARRQKVRRTRLQPQASHGGRTAFGGCGKGRKAPNEDALDQHDEGNFQVPVALLQRSVQVYPHQPRRLLAAAEIRLYESRTHDQRARALDIRPHHALGQRRAERHTQGGTRQHQLPHHHRRDRAGRQVLPQQTPRRQGGSQSADLFRSLAGSGRPL